MRDAVTTALELLGMAAIVAGVWLIYFPAALIVAGACLFALAWLLTGPARPTTGVDR